MGTRSLTVFKESSGEEIVVMYAQYDGYPSGHGKDLAEFLSDFTVVNGIGERRAKLANGIECLTGQAIAHFKTEVGSYYIYAAGTRDCGEEYIYTITAEVGKEPEIEVRDVYEKQTLFKGAASDMLKWIEDGEKVVNIADYR